MILITLDEVRPDHLSCYGYDRITTQNIDRIAEDGVLFETCISSSCLTPISHASILCGVNPPKHSVRDPFGFIQSKMVSELLKEKGYKTAGFVGSGIIGSKHGFNKVTKVKKGTGCFLKPGTPLWGQIIFKRTMYTWMSKRHVFW